MLIITLGHFIQYFFEANSATTIIELFFLAIIHLNVNIKQNKNKKAAIYAINVVYKQYLIISLKFNIIKTSNNFLIND